MPSYFLDSSALVKGYRREAGSERVNELLRGPHPLIISELSHLEVSAAIVRRADQMKMAPAEVHKALDELDREVAQSLEIIAIDHLEVVSAIQLVRTHRLRAGDALQLAAALTESNRRAQGEFALVSADLELNAAARTEWLVVENPESPP